MFDSISAHEFCKNFICKMTSLITNDDLGAPNLLKRFLCINPTTVMASFLDKLLLPPIWIHNPHLGECIYHQMMEERVP